MSNWKERAEEAAARKIEENAQRDKSLQKIGEQRSAARVSEERGLTSIGEARLREFDKLGIPKKLADINRDVWRNLGKLKVIRGVTPFGAGNSISLVYTRADDVSEDRETVTALRLGSYEESRTEGSMGEHYTVSERKFGLHDEGVGYRVVGMVRYIRGEVPLSVNFFTDPKSDLIQIKIQDAATVINPPALDLREGWKVTKGNYGDVLVSFHEGNNNPKLLAQIIDDALLQSCVGRLPLIDQWEKERLEAERKTREIQSRVGQIVKFR